ncbi:MAG: N-acetylmuramoyl-L-alanine amidase [Prevotellaceae bacterium]|jgi:N-acetylmuramoyl-L-alanine amidase|nr:N-acetylmuramoyl-L-alanine amidase [Prevotellaceae bacterium]
MFKSIVDIKKVIIFASSLVAFCCYTVTIFSQSVVTQTGVTRVVVDAGHGGLDAGAVGKFSKEKDLNLDVALLAGKFIQDSCPGVEVIYTRKTDIFIPLNERSAIANKHDAHLFISIHANSIDANASRKKAVKGSETYVMGLDKSGSNMEVAMRENAVITYEDNYASKYEGYDPRSPESFIIFSLLQNAHLEQSLQMAARVQEEFGDRPIPNRGVKQAGFLVLWRTAMPSVLVEMGYISNEQEEKILNNKETKTAIAHAIFRAFKSYKNYYDRDLNLAQYSNKKSQEVKKDEIPLTLHYRIQIKASSKKIPLDAPEFTGYEDVQCIPFSAIYKYTVGNFTTFEAATRYCEDIIRPKIADAFVVCVEKGKIVPMKK